MWISIPLPMYRHNGRRKCIRQCFDHVWYKKPLFPCSTFLIHCTFDYQKNAAMNHNTKRAVELYQRCSQYRAIVVSREPIPKSIFGIESTTYFNGRLHLSTLKTLSFSEIRIATIDQRQTVRDANPPNDFVRLFLIHYFRKIFCTDLKEFFIWPVARVLEDCQTANLRPAFLTSQNNRPYSFVLLNSAYFLHRRSEPGRNNW